MTLGLDCKIGQSLFSVYDKTVVVAVTTIRKNIACVSEDQFLHCYFFATGEAIFEIIIVHSYYTCRF